MSGSAPTDAAGGRRGCHERARQLAHALASGLREALAFLTVVPVRSASGPPGTFACALFPLVGALLGALAAALRIGLDRAGGDTLAALVGALALVLATGALHLDALADCADAVGARARERRLEILRDPRLGTFGVVAVVVWLLGSVAALGRLEGERALVALIAACACARFAALAQALATVPALRDGLGAAFSPSAGAVLGAAALALPPALTPALVVDAGWALGLTLLVAAGTLGALSGVLARRALGGRTGDTLGAAIAGYELLALVVLAATLA